jgi:hypothetical protein
MRKVESLVIKYVGYKDPSCADEVELEILGLETAIAAAKQRITVLRQGLKLERLVLGDKQYAEAVKKASDSSQAEQKG